MPTATADPGLHTEPGTAPLRSDRPRARWRAATVPSGSFVAFRIAFGVLVAIGQLRFLARGWVGEFYLEPRHHLTYPHFGWVEPLPGPLMYALVLTLAGLGIAVAVGWHVRLAAALFAIGFAYGELIDAALYLNHYWFLTLAAVVLAVVPGPTSASGGRRVPLVSVWALRAQLAMVYFFAGVAKLNSDWLLRAEPLHTWLSARTDRPLIGPWLDEWLVALGFSWAGALFDLTIVAWLLWRRARPIAYAVLVVFHVATAMMFQIGMFPWVMIALTPIFFAPDWPRRLGLVRVNGSEGARAGRTRPVRRTTLVALAVLAALNVALPMRHVFADGNVRWNDDGYLLAWRVMLTERATHVTYLVTDPSAGTTFEVGADSVLEEWQSASAMVRADLILSTAHLVADQASPIVGDDVEVRVDAWVAWNGRLRQRWIDASVDLAALPRDASASAYVLSAP